jgi:Peptidase family M23
MVRAGLFVVACGCLVGVQPSVATQPDFRLQLVPAVVYKVDDPGGASTSSFVFDIAVICSTDCALTPISARVELSSAGSTVERQDWTTEMLAKTKRTRYRIVPSTMMASPTRAFTLPEAFDVRFYFRHPQALAIDSAVVRLTVADARGRRVEQALRIPIRYYQQKTALIVPFRGHGIVGQDWVTSGGHRDFSTGFAVDLDGLDQNDGELSDANENAADAGWNREILAPAAGTVVYARNDVPNNPHLDEEPDSNFYKTLHDPVLAYAGNCVIIDHGNSEYSVMMHMQPGSVTVKVGDRVATGQVIGRLGNSGDAFGPHLHYQLQSGPQLFRDEPLPFRFQNIDVPQLSRGTYFDAK